MEYGNRLSLFSHGMWFQTPKPFFSFLRDSEAICLAILINISNMRIKAGHDHSGWVRITTPQVQKEISWAESKVNNLITRLEAKGFIQKKLAGLPAKRWIWIDIDAVYVACGLLAPSGAGLVAPKGANSSAPKGASKHIVLKKYLKEHCLRCATDKEWKELGEKLKLSIASVRTIATSSRPNKWWEHLRRIHITDNVPVDKIEEVVLWYCDLLLMEGDVIANGNPNYIPVAYSGAAVRDKFEKLEACKIRMASKKKARKQRYEHKVKLKVVEYTGDDEDEDEF